MSKIITLILTVITVLGIGGQATAMESIEIPEPEEVHSEIVEARREMSIERMKSMIAQFDKKFESLNFYEGEFELPINGASGYASTALRVTKDEGSVTIYAGEPFVIMQEEGDYFRVRLASGEEGKVESKYCLVNLPDILPSIIYKNTNGDASIFRSAGYPLDGVTGEKMYESYYINNRLGKMEFVMPVLYGMSKKIAQAQKAALENGDTLVIYETYRPYATQKKVVSALDHLMYNNADVYKAINMSPWHKGWFIAQGMSYHQMGGAMDVSLAKVITKKLCQSGDYAYYATDRYEEYEMPTAMHELSGFAAAHKSPIDSNSKTAWKSATFADTMTEGAIKMHEYCLPTGLTPLSSEWWHFNDLYSLEACSARQCNGGFTLKENANMPAY